MPHYFTDSFNRHFANSRTTDLSSWISSLKNEERLTLCEHLQIWLKGYGIISHEEAFDVGHLMFSYLKVFRNRSRLREGENEEILRLILNDLLLTIQIVQK